jgi:signal transduction histidine kinase
MGEMHAQEVIGVHRCVRSALPSILGVLVASAIMFLGMHVLVDRSLMAWTRKITFAVAPGEQSGNEIGMAAADLTRTVLLADSGHARERIAAAGDELRLAAARYDRWAEAAQLAGVMPTAPLVAAFERRTLAALGTPDEEIEIDSAADQLAARLRANSEAAAAAAAAALDRFSHVETLGRLLHVGMLLLFGGGCAALLLSALRREELACAHEAEVARRIDETNADLEAFAGRVAHDLRNPLMPILTGSQVIERTAELPRVRQTAERIERSARRLAGMIDTLLSFSRLTGARTAARSDVCAAIGEVVDNFRERAEAEGVRLHVDCPPLDAACEPIVLSSTLQNLIENALKYGRRPGVEPVVEVRAYGRDGQVVIEVEDHGPGINPGDAEALFQPFRRGGLSGDGVGLGLATAHRLVEARGGSLNLRGEHAGGALFEVVLPAAEPAGGAPRSTLGDPRDA